MLICTIMFCNFLQLPVAVLKLRHILSTGGNVAFPGHPLGSGLTPAAAKARHFVLKTSH